MGHTRHAYGPLVRALREARNLTLVELGLATGLSPGYLSRIEREGRMASSAATFALAAALRVLPQELTGQCPPYRALRCTLYRTTSVEDFADSVGLTADELADIERGTTAPDPAVRDLIAQRLGVPAMVLAPGRAES